MAITSTEPKRSHADILRGHLEAAGLSQRAGARALHLDERTMRRYCSGSAEVPVMVLYMASKLRLIERNKRVIEMLDAGKLSTSDGDLTREQFAKHNKTLLAVIEYLVGRGELDTP